MTLNMDLPASCAADKRPATSGGHGVNRSAGKSILAIWKSAVSAIGARWRVTSVASSSSSSISIANMSASMVSGTSRRTALPKRRRRSSISTAANKSSASSSSSDKSALRDTRNVWHCSMFIPGNSRPRFAVITSSINTKRVEPGTDMKRGKFCGILTRAKRRSCVRGSLAMMARLRARLEMYGNGCAGSTASGVSTGKILVSNCSAKYSRSVGLALSQLIISIPCWRNWGTSSLFHVLSCASTSCCTRLPIACNCA